MWSHHSSACLREVRFVAFFIWFLKKQNKTKQNLLYFSLVYPLGVFFLSRHYESSHISFLLALLGKLVSVFADILHLGHCTIGRDWITTCNYLPFVFILYASLFFFVAGFALMQVGLAYSNTYNWILLRSSWSFSWNVFHWETFASHAGKFIGWRKLLSIMEILILDFGYLCHWRSSMRISSYSVPCGGVGFPAPTTVDSDVSPVSHSSLVETFNLKMIQYLYYIFGWIVSSKKN